LLLLAVLEEVESLDGDEDEDELDELSFADDEPLEELLSDEDEEDALRLSVR
jgi:hypothetical protein